MKRCLASRLPMIAVCLAFFGCGNDAPPKAAGNGDDAERGRLLLRQGFMLEGRRRECEVKDGAFVRLDYYGLLNPAEAV